MSKKILLLLLPVLAITACEEYDPRAVGQLISDRIELVAESAEPITSIFVLEGAEVAEGANILQQDSSRIEVQITEAQANIAGIEAFLAEQINGPRQVTVSVIQAALNEAEVERDFRSRELVRLESLLEQDFAARETIDLARNRLDAANARIVSVQSQLKEIEAGTRVEQIEQTQQTLAQAKARLAKLMIDLERAVISAPVDAILDSLPFELGERPRAGDVVAVLLAGSQPHARVYIPEELRISIQPGDDVRIMIDGLATPVLGNVRRISSEASFTPYFALTENDRGRLSFVAEISLADRPQRLPDGLPVEILLTNDVLQ
jgi:HlyD family secretion protein